MTINEIFAKGSGLPVYENRSINGDYGEFVIFSKDKGVWEKMLSEIYGGPVKPAGQKPSRDDVAATKNYGGVRDNQTLYRKDTETQMLLAMFWPWSDNMYITIKLAALKK